MSAKVQPMVFLWVFNISNNFPSCSASRFEKIITGNVSLSPKYAYFKFWGSGLSSKVGGFSMDGNGMVEEYAVMSTLATSCISMEETIQV